MTETDTYQACELALVCLIKAGYRSKHVYRALRLEGYSPSDISKAASNILVQKSEFQ